MAEDRVAKALEGGTALSVGQTPAGAVHRDP